MNLKRIVGGAGALMALSLWAYCWGESSEVPLRGLKSISQVLAPPPRSIADIRDLLDRSAVPPSRSDKPRELLATPVPAGLSGKDLIDFHLRRASAAELLGDSKRRVSELQEAESHALNDGDALNQVLGELINALSNGGDFAESIRKAEQRHAAYRNTRHRGAVFGSLSTLVKAHVKAGQIDRAGDLFRETEKAFWQAMEGNQGRQYKRFWWRRDLEATRAALLGATGRYAEAEAAITEALEQYKEDIPWQARRVQAGIDGPSDTHHRITGENLLANLATAQLRNGKVLDAESTSRQLLTRTLSRTGRHSAGTATALATLARAVSQQGRHGDAIYLLEQAVLSLERSGAVPASDLMAESRRLIAGEFVMLENCNKALDHYGHLANLRKDGSKTKAALGRGDKLWAYALLRCNRPAESLAMLEGIYQETRKSHGEDHYDTAEARGFLAMAALRSGDGKTAREHFEEALPILVADELGRTNTLKATAAKRKWIVQSYIGLLADEHAAKPDPKLVANAFRFADLPRGQAAQQAITASASRAAADNPQLSGLARQEQDARRELNEAYEMLFRMLALPAEQQPPEVLPGLRKRIEERRETAARLRKEIDQEFPRYARLIAPKAATLDDVRSALTPEEAFIGILPLDGSTLVWIVTKDGPPLLYASALSEHAIGEAVRKLRSAVDPGAVALGDIPEFDLATAFRLYDELLRPGRVAWEKSSTLVIAASGSLSRLPLAALPTARHELAKNEGLLFERYRGVPWLGRTHAFAYVPSAAAFVSLRTQAPGRASRTSFIGFGDPDFAAGEKPQMVTTRGGAPLLRSGINSRKAGVAGEFVALSALPDTRDEILAIAGTLKANMQRDVFLGTAASKASVRNAALADRRVVAFATHGLIPGDLPGLTQPALALTPSLADGDNGLLTLEDILKLKMNADWVILSACNTAADDDAMDSLSGLGPGFFYAGARSILATHWPVESVSARELVTEIFRSIAREKNLSRALALRQSILHMIDGNQRDASSGRKLFSYAHPIFWAPYTLFGDGR